MKSSLISRTFNDGPITAIKVHFLQFFIVINFSIEVKITKRQNGKALFCEFTQGYPDMEHPRVALFNFLFSRY